MTEWGGYLFFSILRRVIRFSTTTWNDATPKLTGDANKELYEWGQPIMFVELPTMLVVAFNGGEGTLANVMGYTGGAEDTARWHLLYQATATMSACGYSRAKDCRTTPLRRTMQRVGFYTGHTSRAATSGTKRAAKKLSWKRATAPPMKRLRLLIAKPRKRVGQRWHQRLFPVPHRLSLV